MSSQTEQKFDSLCSFAEKLNLSIRVQLNDNGWYWIMVEPKLNGKMWCSNSHPKIDQAITEALRYLRKISKQQNK